MPYEQITSDFEQKLKTCRRLPSPPTYALQVIALANDPDADIAQAVKVFSMDPVIVSKILRIANSPLYANQRKVETLQIATLLLGMSATISLALSFSLVSELRQVEHGVHLDHTLYWKRAGLAAAAGRVLGTFCEIRDLEELFIASLLQDIGLLALDHISPEVYKDLNQENHMNVVAKEHQQLGLNHATVGGWLLAQWQLPDRLHLAVAHSEDPLQIPVEDEHATFVRCVAGAGALANLFLNGCTDNLFQETRDKLEAWLKLPQDRLTDIFEQMRPVLEEVDHLFDMKISQEVHAEDLIEMARESQLLQYLHISHEVEKLKESTITLETQKGELERCAQRDGLTNLYNRSFLDEYLDKTFERSIRDGHPLSVGFIDLDHFKQVNDTYGHPVGDLIIKATADILKTHVRRSDVVGRYGGEEFVVVLPETPATGAHVVFQKILQEFRATCHNLSSGEQFFVTASIGFATLSREQHFLTSFELIKAADEALYHVKQHGRNNCLMYECASARD